MHTWYNVPQHNMLQKTILEPSEDSISKRSKPSVSLKRKVRGNAAGSLGFCTCWTLELSSHIVKNLWSGTTETKSPQEFFLARVPTIVMDILNDLLLARRQRFLNNCFTVTTVLIVKRRFVCHHLVSSIAVGIKFVLLCLCRKGTSRVQFFQVRPRLCHSTFPWRLACEISQQVHSIFSWESNLVTFKPRVMMDEISKVRTVRDIGITSVVLLHSLGRTSKQRVLTENVEFTRPISGC